MNRKPGQVTVVTEVGYCPFCTRPRNLRREERQLGTLTRVTLSCETCHRTLESSIGVASTEAPESESVEAPPEKPKTVKAAKKAASPTAAAGPKAKAAVKPKSASTAKRSPKGR
ncbi:MAG TPA: hypothetical protein VGG90_01650 [Candidatus Dormibacteraeota bacterium]|jgi:hypothetical protein